MIWWELDRGRGRERLGPNLNMAGGLQNLLLVVFGLGGTALSATNLKLAVGDDASSGADATLTKLQAETTPGNALRKATTPSRSGETVAMSASFTGAEANFAWNEWGIAWGTSGAGGLLSRFVPSPSFGAKTAGETWTLTAFFALAGS